MTNNLDFEGWTCPVPLRDTPTVVMGHGGGGAMSAELVEHLFLPAYGAAAAGGPLGDSAVLPPVAGRLAFSTDTFVVKPMFFPGGSIGDLAVNGTVNDLAMVGATPLHLSTVFSVRRERVNFVYNNDGRTLLLGLFNSIPDVLIRDVSFNS